jgi:hypothetical protein
MDQVHREFILLYTEWAIILFALFWLYVQSIFTNWAYYLHSADVDPLQDALFGIFPEVPE